MYFIHNQVARMLKMSRVVATILVVTCTVAGLQINSVASHQGEDGEVAAANSLAETTAIDLDACNSDKQSPGDTRNTMTSPSSVGDLKWFLEAASSTCETNTELGCSSNTQVAQDSQGESFNFAAAVPASETPLTHMVDKM